MITQTLGTTNVWPVTLELQEAQMSKRSNCKKPKCQKWPITTFRRIQPNVRRFDHNTLVNVSNPGTFIQIRQKVVSDFFEDTYVPTAKKTLKIFSPTTVGTAKIMSSRVQ